MRKITFAIGITFVCIVLYITKGEVVIEGNYLMNQVALLSDLCAFINLIYRSEKLTFKQQSILGYLLTTLTVIGWTFMLNWYQPGMISIGLVQQFLSALAVNTVIYIIIWFILWQRHKATKKRLNDGLQTYQQTQKKI